MGFVLDAIVKKELFGSRDETGTNYETINSSGQSDFVDASGTEQGFVVSVTYDNGVGNDVDFTVEGSLDGVSYGPLPDTETNITDGDGSITWDINNSNANFIRVAWTVNSGSMDIFCQFSGKRRH